MPRSPGHAFYDRLQALLKEAGFDAFVEDLCKPYYAPRMGAPSLPPGRYFRMHMVGYFERYRQRARHLLALFRIRCRFASSCAWRAATRLPIIPGCRRHARACRTRSTKKVFGWVLSLVAEREFGEGRADRRRRLDDGSQRCPAGRSCGATAARPIAQMLTQMAKESGVETPTIGRPGPAGSQAEGQETLEPRIGRARPIRMRRSRG